MRSRGAEDRRRSRDCALSKASVVQQALATTSLVRRAEIVCEHAFAMAQDVALLAADLASVARTLHTAAKRDEARGGARSAHDCTDHDRDGDHDGDGEVEEADDAELEVEVGVDADAAADTESENTDNDIDGDGEADGNGDGEAEGDGNGDGEAEGDVGAEAEGDGDGKAEEAEADGDVGAEATVSSCEPRPKRAKASSSGSASRGGPTAAQFAFFVRSKTDSAVWYERTGTMEDLVRVIHGELALPQITRGELRAYLRGHPNDELFRRLRHVRYLGVC